VLQATAQPTAVPLGCVPYWRPQHSQQMPHWAVCRAADHSTANRCPTGLCAVLQTTAQPTAAPLGCVPYWRPQHSQQLLHWAVCRTGDHSTANSCPSGLCAVLETTANSSRPLANGEEHRQAKSIVRSVAQTQLSISRPCWHDKRNYGVSTGFHLNNAVFWGVRSCSSCNYSRFGAT
jgi:hypothetical protein